MPLYKIYLTDIINPISDKKCPLIRQGIIVTKRFLSGYRIIELGYEKDIFKKYYKKRSIEVVQMISMVAMPSFFDMHFHWVQDQVCLMPKRDLLEWLKKYTWPHEAKFKNRNFSKKQALEFSKKLLRVGTLGGACYSSIHGHTVDHSLGSFVGEFIVGNVLMTNNSPKYLCQSEKNAIGLVEKKSLKFKNRYALTPRFAITVGPSTMKKSARIAKRNRSYIQTHLSETKFEIDTVLKLFRQYPKFKDVKSYTEIYQKCNLLSEKTIMGHVIHVSSKELEILKKTGTAIAHCPSSNAPVSEIGLGSGLFDFKRVENYKIPWALASDIGGGPYLSMFDVMRSFVLQNKMKDNGATYTKGLFRSTLAGASILGLDKSCGNLNVSKYANMIFLDAPKIKKNEDSEDVLKRIMQRKSIHRSDFDSIVRSTVYRGVELYSS